MHGFSRASEPGAFLVDTLPWLKYIPSWVPGASFQVEARRMWEERERLYDVPYDFVKGQMVSVNNENDDVHRLSRSTSHQTQGQAAQSFVQAFLTHKTSVSLADEDIIKAAAASLYSGGVDSVRLVLWLSTQHCLIPQSLRPRRRSARSYLL